MYKYSRFYLSGQTHPDATSIVNVKGAATSVGNNTVIYSGDVPLAKYGEKLIVPKEGYVEIKFYPFFITNAIKNNMPYFFRTTLLDSEYPDSISIETNSGSLIDKSTYFLDDVSLYHNYVNLSKDRYYFIKYPQRVGTKSVNFSKRELLRSDLVMREVGSPSVVSTYTYAVSLTSGKILLYATPGTYYISYKTNKLLNFQMDFDASQNWWASVKNFAYKPAGTNIIFSTFDNYNNEDFYPRKGMNFIIDRNLTVDDNGIIFATARPINLQYIEYPIIDLDTQERLPIRSVDMYSGAIEINQDDLKNASKTVFNIGYFISQDSLVLDRSNLQFPARPLVDFNPVFNKDVLDSYVVTYARPYSSAGEKVYQAHFVFDNIKEVKGFYLKETYPLDNEMSQYINGKVPLSLKVFMDNFDVLKHPSPSAVLILGYILVHDNISSTGLRSYCSDIRELGGGINPDSLNIVLDKYPESRYYWELQTLEGDVLPVMTTFMVYVPNELLTFFRESDIKDKVAKHANAAHYAILLSNEANKLVNLGDSSAR